MQDTPTSTTFAETDFSSLIGSIYDAAVTTGRWSAVLEDCRHFVGGASAAIFAKNVTGDRAQLHFTDGRVGAEHVRTYFSRLAQFDPSNTVQVLADVGTAIITSQKLSPEDFARSRFAREWATPLGLVDMVVAPIERRGSWAALFGVFRHERDGVGDEEARRRVELLAPHVRRAVDIGGIIGKAGREADNFREAIDGLSAGVVLVDAEGRLVHANAAARALIGTSNAMTPGDGGTLRLDRDTMRDVLPRSGRPQPASALMESPTGERLVAHVLPLTGGARQFTGLGGDAVAALFVQRARFDPPSIPDSLARAFDLTPAELRVALATLRNDGVAEIADRLGVAETTVKTHLGRIFSKTDTRRQADIVKLVVAFASPLRAAST